MMADQLTETLEALKKQNELIIALLHQAPQQVQAVSDQTDTTVFSSKVVNTEGHGTLGCEADSEDEVSEHHETPSTASAEPVKDVSIVSDPEEVVPQEAMASDAVCTSDCGEGLTFPFVDPDVGAQLRADPLYMLSQNAHTKLPHVSGGMLDINLEGAILWHRTGGMFSAFSLPASIESIQNLFDRKAAGSETAAIVEETQTAFEFADLPRVIEAVSQTQKLEKNEHLRASLSRALVFGDKTYLMAQSVEGHKRTAIGDLLVFLPSGAEGGELSVWQEGAKYPRILDISSACRTGKAAWAFIPLEAKYSLNRLQGGRLALCYKIEVQTVTVANLPLHQDVTRTECYHHLVSIMQAVKNHGRVLASVLTEKPVVAASPLSSALNKIQLVGFDAVLWNAAQMLGLPCALIRVGPGQASKWVRTVSVSDRRTGSSDSNRESSTEEDCSETEEEEEEEEEEDTEGYGETKQEDDENNSEYSETSVAYTSDTESESSVKIGDDGFDTTDLESSEYFKTRFAEIEAAYDETLQQQAEYEKDMKDFEVFAPDSIPNYSLFDPVSPHEATFKQVSGAGEIPFEEALTENVYWLRSAPEGERYKSSSGTQLDEPHRFNFMKQAILIHIPALDLKEADEVNDAEEPPRKKPRAA